MPRTLTVICGTGALASFIACGLWLFGSVERVPGAERAQQKNRRTIKPVEGDMHEFMGHLFGPTFERLRRSIASKPTSDGEWKNIATDALILGEGGNLLLVRSPDEQGDPWASNATGIRTFGSFVYRAAREKDYTTALFNYRHMVEQCNDCHREFAAGEPRLEP